MVGRLLSCIGPSLITIASARSKSRPAFATLPILTEPFSSSLSSRTLTLIAGSRPAAAKASKAARNIAIGPLSSDAERANSRQLGSIAASQQFVAVNLHPASALALVLECGGPRTLLRPLFG